MANGGKTGGEAAGEVGRGESIRHPERRSDDATDSLGPEVKNLIETCKERGFVTYDELNKVLPDDMVSPEKLDRVLQKMDDLGIEMVESAAGEGDKSEAGHEPAEEEREFEGPREREQKTAGGSIRIDDPVRLYLTQMGEIPLLSRGDELRLASRIEITRKRFRTKVLESPVAVAAAIQLLEDVKNGDLAFDRTLKADSSIDVSKIEVLDPSVENPVASATHRMLRDRIEATLQSLSFREREILKLLYGIGIGYTYTLEEVGKLFKVTRERVRQIEAKALRKLQHPLRSRMLEGFVEGMRVPGAGKEEESRG